MLRRGKEYRSKEKDNMDQSKRNEQDQGGSGDADREEEERQSIDDVEPFRGFEREANEEQEQNREVESPREEETSDRDEEASQVTGIASQIQLMMSYIINMNQNMEKKITDSMTKLDSNMEKKMDNMKEEIVKKMEQGQKQFEIKITKIEEKVKDVEAATNQLKEDQNKIENRMDDIQTSVIILEQKQDKFNGEYRNEVKEITNDMFKEKEKQLKEKVKGEIRKELKETNVKINKIEEDFHKEKIENREDKMNNRELIINNINDVQTKYENLQKQLQNLNNRESTGICMRNNIMGGINENNLKFYGNNNRIHPKMFLRSLKYRLRGVTNLEDIKEILRNIMVNEAYLWFSTKEEEINDFHHFETLFLKEYWGEHQQRKSRNNLHFGKYIEGSKKIYVQTIYNGAQFLEPKMTEEEIVKCLARHFHERITETINIQDIKTMEQLSQYLTRLDNGSWRTEDRNSRRNYRPEDTANTYNNPRRPNMHREENRNNVRENQYGNSNRGGGRNYNNRYNEQYGNFRNNVYRNTERSNNQNWREGREANNENDRRVNTVRSADIVRTPVNQVETRREEGSNNSQNF